MKTINKIVEKSKNQEPRAATQSKLAPVLFNLFISVQLLIILQFYFIWNISILQFIWNEQNWETKCKNIYIFFISNSWFYLQSL